MADPSTQTPLRLFLFDGPRTCSQLFFKILGSHPKLVPMHQPISSAATYGPESYIPYLRRSDRAERIRKERNERFWIMFKDWTYAKAGANVLREVEKIEAEGRSVLAKEHAHFLMKPDVLLSFLGQNPGMGQSIRSNDILLPSSLIDSLTPLLLFRHPALRVPSNWRTQIPVTDWDIEDEDLPVWSSLQWVRMLFDFFWERSRSNDEPRCNQMPILIEASDVVHNTVPLVNVVCKRLDLDPAGVRYGWEKVEIVDSFVKYDSLLVNRYMAHLNASTGVERAHEPDPTNIDIEAEQRKWKVEFGEVVARRLRKLVDAEMLNYEYLRRHKVTC